MYPEALTMYYPANGQNYGDSRVYSIFFNNKVEMTVENILQVKGLTAVVSDDHGVDLTWTPTKFAEGYTIERAKVLASNEDGKLFGEFEVLGTVTEPGYQDSDLQFGEYFVYRVTAFKDGGTTSGNGNSVEVYIHPGNETETAALVVIDLIKNLPSVITMEAKDTIIAIRTAYDELTAEAKELVYNYNDFVKAENQLAVLEKEAADKAAAEAVENLIAAIPQPVTLACEEAIEGARQGYDSLTEEQKALVKNYELLTASEETLVQIKEEEKRKEDEAAASKVEDIINALPKNITLHSEPAVVAAREAYDTLTEDQKALVDNYEFLTAAEKKIADLKAEEKRKEDEKAASKVEKLIKLLPRKITLLSEPLIKGAREGYDKLTEDQKALVDNYHVLVAAENRLAEIKEERAKDKEAAAKVEAIIEDLPTKITKDHGPVIKAARKAYDNLTLAQKLLVNNYPKLIKAEVDLWKAEHSNCPWWSLCHWIN